MADLVALRVSGLRENTTEADVRAAFATYGFINDVTIEDGGRAIVQYITRPAQDAARAAVEGFLRAEPHQCAASEDGLNVKLYSSTLPLDYTLSADTQQQAPSPSPLTPNP